MARTKGRKAQPGDAASRKNRRGGSRSRPKSEYPLSAPYEFEGFTTADETLKSLRASVDAEAPPSPSILVTREGQNAYGTWGRIFTWDGSKWVSQGHTLEPRSTVGKGPIPLGSYQFTRQVSPKLRKCERLHNVPGFTDILIHVGNKQEETVGCILAGRDVDNPTSPTELRNSRVLTDWLYDNLTGGGVQVQSK